ncbi:VOC family protein [Microcoleus sp. MOSTC5]|uniref:VOC family protein n=1 Tax=Microcoleus sp. MOSTC5 TaxID=3055378 RepID=UPI002FD707FA
MQKIRAIALMVKDADRSQDFYRKALSFEPVSDITVEGQKFALLLLGLKPTAHWNRPVGCQLTLVLSESIIC